MELDAALKVLGLSLDECTAGALMTAYNRKRVQSDFSYDIILRAMNKASLVPTCCRNPIA